MKEMDLGQGIFGQKDYRPRPVIRGGWIFEPYKPPEEVKKEKEEYEARLKKPLSEKFLEDSGYDW